MNFKWNTTLPKKQHKNKSPDFEVDGRIWRIVLANYDGVYVSLEYRGTSIIPAHTITHFTINGESFELSYEYNRFDNYFGKYLFRNDVDVNNNMVSADKTGEKTGMSTHTAISMHTAESSAMFQSAHQIDDNIEIEVRIRLIGDYNSKGSTGYVGIRNMGATCYINSLVQVLYNINAFYNRVMSIRTTVEHDDGMAGELGMDGGLSNNGMKEGLSNNGMKEGLSNNGMKEGLSNNGMKEGLSNNGLSENSSGKDKRKMEKKTNKYNLKALQQMFYKLLTYKSEVYPDLMFRNLSLLGPLDQHQDFHEYSKKLLDELEYETDEKCFNSLFDGEITQYIHAKCGCRKESVEKFYDLQLDVRQNIKEAMDAYFEEYELCGDNKYRCDTHGLVDAVKGQVIRKVPDVLFVLIKRFSMDWDANEVVKNNGYCEFRDELEINGERLMLKGVVVHSGVSSDGHYYCYVRCAQDDAGQRVWLKFNDHIVTKVTENEVLEHNRGGKHPYRKVELPFSAYGLFYLKDDSVEKMPLTDEIVSEIRANEARSYNCNILTKDNIKGHTGPGFYNITCDYPRTQLYTMNSVNFKEMNVEKKYHYVFEVRDGELCTKVRWSDNVLIFSFFTNVKYDFVNEHRLVFVKKLDDVESVEYDYSNALRLIDIIVIGKDEKVSDAIVRYMGNESLEVYIEDDFGAKRTHAGTRNGTIAIVCTSTERAIEHLRYLADRRCINFVNRSRSFTLFLKRTCNYAQVTDIVKEYLMDQKVAIAYFKESVNDLRTNQVPFYTEDGRRLVYFGRGCLDYNRIRHIHVLSVDESITVSKFKHKYKPGCVSDLTAYYVVECVVNTPIIRVLNDDDVMGTTGGLLVFECTRSKFFRACHAVYADSKYQVTGFPFLFFYENEQTFGDVRIRCGFLGKLVLFDGECYKELDNADRVELQDNEIVFIMRG
ncbi:hypothetical protein VCUG_01915 [Vavraia culicis subsp. floridensis]|uniref:USP domain-containing protein n=1 Tax=Vavraia culicis (isolate floridensis) TaxID=948595 RepID=L2GU09_VAVCU|nr:uncharacterized protein VCUG_01915 [Vavraia culicis subsp. floridensis]ELA46585.1 hypothetical protein VCUG_01915 [Vavraia culicis subsp. floridensis]